jgi:hypothetical protein
MFDSIDKMLVQVGTVHDGHDVELSSFAKVGAAAGALNGGVAGCTLAHCAPSFLRPG